MDKEKEGKERKRRKEIKKKKKIKGGREGGKRGEGGTSCGVQQFLVIRSDKIATGIFSVWVIFCYQVCTVLASFVTILKSV